MDPVDPKSESGFGSGSGTLVEAYFYIVNVHLSLPVTRYSLLASRIHGRTISLRKCIVIITGEGAYHERASRSKIWF
jgi:hypothetical protein